MDECDDARHAVADNIKLDQNRCGTDQRDECRDQLACDRYFPDPDPGKYKAEYKTEQDGDRRDKDRGRDTL